MKTTGLSVPVTTMSAPMMYVTAAAAVFILTKLPDHPAEILPIQTVPIRIPAMIQAPVFQTTPPMVLPVLMTATNVPMINAMVQDYAPILSWMLA
jgi:hypothetical protein